MRSYEAVQQRREAEKRYQDSIEEQKEALQKIIEHPETITIKRENLPDPWIYVEDMFPRIAASITGMTVYKNENTAFYKKIKVPPTVGGLFFIRSSTILICWTKEKFKDDVVICHELLHYAGQLLNGGPMGTEAIEESFAYSKSIKYLNLHGYSDKWIIEQYMLPYWSGFERRMEEKVLGRALTNGEKEQNRQKAITRCQAIIDFELSKFETKPALEEIDRFDLI
jgi:hypothetical protein